jgi:hypothetical protein
VRRMEQRHESYRGHDIVVEPGAERAIAEASEGEAEPVIYIDEEPVVAVRDSAGGYIAAGFAYAPQDSPLELARRIVDYRKAIEEADRGGQEEPGQPDAG